MGFLIFKITERDSFIKTLKNSVILAPVIPDYTTQVTVKYELNKIFNFFQSNFIRKKFRHVR